MVKEQHLVFNLIPPEDLTVPDEALAILSYGEGFVPTPKFNREEFQLQAFNARNKLVCKHSSKQSSTGYQ